MKNFLRDQRGLGLSAMIALGFVIAVVVVFAVALITYFVKS